MQLNHYNSNFKKQKHPITVVCDNISNAPNIGSLFRICDAFGVDKLVFCGSNIQLGRKITKTSRSTEKYVAYSLKENATEVVKDFKEKDYFLIALEISKNSKPLNEFKLQTHQPIVIVLGDENFGVSDAILKLVDATVHINMFGNNSSMNVVQAASIALYEITNQLNVKV